MNTAALKSMDLATLRALNTAIVGEIRLRNNLKAAEVARSLSIGDIVKFTGKYGVTVKGRVTTFHPKNIGVVALNPDGSDSRSIWRVHPALLSRVFA